MYKQLVAILLCIYACSVSGQNSKLQISLFYGPLCRDSFNFVTNELASAYDYIADYVEISYVPFGKSESVDGGESFICQHGPGACDGSRLQLCSLYLLADYQRLKAEYVICQMYVNSDKSGETCAELVGLNFEDVLSCFYSDLGTQLQLGAEVKTNNIQYPLVWVPTIAYNNVFDQDLQNRSEFDFFNVVCEQLAILNESDSEAGIPAECSEIVPY